MSLATALRMHYPTIKNIELETILSYLHLKTVDETQTAFAKSGIHISETTAFKWRELAKEDSVSQLWDNANENEDTGTNPASPDPETKCFQRLSQAWKRIFSSEK
jgi:hypothetical protein